MDPPPPKLGQPGVILLHLTRDGRVLYGGKEIGIEGVGAIVSRCLERADLPVIIQSEPDASTGHLVHMIDQAKLAGAIQVSIASPDSGVALPSWVSTKEELGIPAEFETDELSSLDTKPRIIRRVSPTMSAELRKHLPASVWVNLIVNAKGEVAKAKIQKSTDSRFDKTSLIAVEKWKFQPALRKGEPVSSHLRVCLEFPSELGADGPSQVVLPRAIHQVSPAVSRELRAHVPATVWLNFVVTHDGRVNGLKVQESTDPRFNAAALEAVKNWKFEPAMREGKPIAMRMRIPMNFGDDRPPILPYPVKSIDLVGVEENQKSQNGLAKGGSIRGLVLDEDFETPIAKPVITVLETGTKIIGSNKGTFVVEGLAAGDYTLILAKDGYVSQTKASVIVRGGTITQMQVSLSGHFEELEELEIEEKGGGGKDSFLGSTFLMLTDLGRG